MTLAIFSISFVPLTSGKALMSNSRIRYLHENAKKIFRALLMRDKIEMWEARNDQSAKINLQNAR